MADYQPGDSQGTVLIAEATGDRTKRRTLLRDLSQAKFNPEFFDSSNKIEERIQEMDKQGLNPPVAIVMDKNCKHWGEQTKAHLQHHPEIPVVVFNAGRLAGLDDVVYSKIQDNHVAFISGPISYIPGAIEQVIDRSALASLENALIPKQSTSVARATPAIVYADDETDLHELAAMALPDHNVVTTNTSGQPINGVQRLLTHLKEMKETGQPVAQILVDNKMFLSGGDKVAKPDAGLTAIKAIRNRQKEGSISPEIPIGLLSTETNEPHVAQALAEINSDPTLLPVTPINKNSGSLITSLNDGIEAMEAMVAQRRAQSENQGKGAGGGDIPDPNTKILRFRNTAFSEKERSPRGM